MRFLRWSIFVLLLGIVAGLIYLSSLTKEEAKRIFPISLPSSFYAKEYNTFAKNISSPNISSIISIDDKTLIAVGRDGVILKSVDGGNSFRVIDSPTKENLYAITSLNNKTLMAVGSNGIIIKSTDGGNNFHTINSPTKNWLTSITAIDNRTLIAVGQSGTIIKSTDGGNNFHTINSPTKNWLTSITAIDNRTLIAVGHRGTIIKSTDGGNNFHTINSPTKNGLTSITAIDNRTLIAVGQSGTIIKSTDGGNNFHAINSPTKQGLNSITAIDNKTLIAVGQSGTIIKSTDSGNSFRVIKSPIKKDLYSITAIDDKTLIAVGENGTIIKSIDRGKNFRVVYYPTIGKLFTIISIENKTLIAVGRDGVILKSVDGGNSFKAVNSPTQPNLYSITAIDDKTLIAVGGGGTIIKSTDSGNSFKVIDIGSPAKNSLSTILALDSKTLLAVGNGGTIIKSTDSGNSFKVIDSPVKKTLRDIATTDTKTLIAVGENGTIIKSTNGGNSFKVIDSPTKKFLYSITAIDDKNFIAVGKDGIILKIADRGNNIKVIDSPTKKFLLSITALDDEIVIAVGADGTIIKSINQGNSFQLIDLGQLSEAYRYVYKFDNKVYLLGEVSIISYIDSNTQKIVYLDYYTTYSLWYYILFVLFCFLIVVVAWKTAKDLAKGSKRGANVSSDKPIESLSEDRYGLKTLVDSLVTLISNPYTTTPLSIAIDAPWGYGKSSFIHMSKRELSRLGIRSFIFNAWYHQEEKHLLASLMQGILKHFVPSAFSFEGIVFYTRLFIKRVFLNPVRLFWFVLLIALFYVSVQVDFNLGGCYEHLPKIISLLTLFAFIYKIVKPYEPLTQKFVQGYKTLFGFKSFDENIGLRDEFAKEIADIITPLGKAVIFIDDLDRCSDEDIFKVMQTVNFLTTIDNLFIVMAVDKQKVIDAISRYYKKSGLENSDKSSEIAQNYIEKIFNITIKIPKVDSKFYKDFTGYKHKYQEKDFKKVMAIRESVAARFVEALFTKYFIAILIVGLIVWNFDAFTNKATEGVKKLEEIVVQIKACDNNITDKNITTKDINGSPISTPTKESNNTTDDIKPPREQNNTDVPRIYKDLPVALDARIKEKEWHEKPIVCIYMLVILGFVVLIMLLLRKQKEQKRDEIEKIWNFINTKTKLSPRERNIEFNKINFFVTLGKKHYVENITMGNIFNQLIQFALAFVYTVIYFFAIRSEKNKSIWKRIKNRFLDAFKYAFNIPIEPNNSSVKDDLEMLSEAQYEGKDSRFEVVKF